MNIIALIFEPPVFYSLLIVLFVVSIAVIYSFVRQSKEKEKEAGTSHTRIAELETLVTQKEGEYVRKLSSIEATMKGKEEELNRRNKFLEDQIRDYDKLKKDFAKAEAKLKEKEELAKKETSGKGDLEKKIKDMQNELAKLNKDLSLKNQMYEGLKGQFEELEKEQEKLVQALEEEKQRKAEAKPQEAKPKPRAEPSPQPRGETAIPQSEAPAQSQDIEKPPDQP